MAYGVGVFAISLPDTILTVFFLYFLTSVVGLRPALAGTVVFIGRLWDAVNDPIVGWLSDRTQSLWGRRYPWMIVGVIPLAVLVWLLWSVPPVNRSWLLGYYGLVLMLYDLALTLVVLPYSALAAELAQTYDERTQLISFQSAFDIGGSILVLVLAQVLFTQIVHPQAQYSMLALLCSGLIAIAVGLCIGGTYRRFQAVRLPQQTFSGERSPLPSQVRSVLADKVFRQLLGLYLGGWISLQVVSSLMPYFVIAYMGQTEATVAAVILLVQVSALVLVFGWSALSQRFDKRTIYLIGMPLWIAAQLLLLWLKPDQLAVIYGQAVVAGAGVATAYLVPWAMLPDVIDRHELETGQRQEGVYYGMMLQCQKLGVAIALLLTSLSLDWAGFIPTTPETLTPTQPLSALWMIRGLTSLVPTLLLSISLLLVSRYPITREVHETIRLSLIQRRQSDSHD